MYDIVYNTSKWIPALTLLVGLYTFNDLKKSYGFIYLFVYLGTLTEFVAFLVKNYVIKNTMPIGPVYFALAFLCLAMFYRIQLGTFITRRTLNIFILSVFLFLVFFSVFFQNLYEYASIPGVINSMAMLVFSLLLFLKIMVDAKIEKLRLEPVIWFNLGILISSAGRMFFTAMYNIILKHSEETFLFTHYLSRGPNILLYIFIIIGFIVAKKKAKPITGK